MLLISLIENLKRLQHHKLDTRINDFVACLQCNSIQCNCQMEYTDRVSPLNLNVSKSIQIQCIAFDFIGQIVKSWNEQEIAQQGHTHTNVFWRTPLLIAFCSNISLNQVDVVQLFSISILFMVSLLCIWVTVFHFSTFYTLLH